MTVLEKIYNKLYSNEVGNIINFCFVCREDYIEVENDFKAQRNWSEIANFDLTCYYYSGSFIIKCIEELKKDEIIFTEKYEDFYKILHHRNFNNKIEKLLD